MSITTNKAGPSLVPGRGLGTALDYAVASHRRARHAASVVLTAGLPAGLFPDPAGRSRRGALRAGDEADAGNRRVCRHPVPERGPLQEAGRHLLAAGSRGENGRSARRAAAARDDLALSLAVALRCDRRRAADLLGGACVRFKTWRTDRGADDGKLGPARRRGAARQDGRHASADLGRGDGRHGTDLSRLPAHTRGSGRLETTGHTLDGAGCRHPS